MKKHLLILISLAICACNGTNNVEPETIILKDVLRLNYQSALQKETVGCEHHNDSADIDLGCIYQSNNYYFIISNSSKKTLENISISTDSKSFAVSPEYIKTIKPGENNIGVMPILRFSIYHRSPLNTVNETKSLQQGFNEVYLTVRCTIDGEELTAKYRISVYAEKIYINKVDGQYYLQGPAYLNDSLVYSVKLLYNNNGGDTNTKFVRLFNGNQSAIYLNWKYRPIAVFEDVIESNYWGDTESYRIFSVNSIEYEGIEIRN